MIKSEIEAILYEYYNILMDEYDGHASEEAIEDLLDKLPEETSKTTNAKDPDMVEALKKFYDRSHINNS